MRAHYLQHVPFEGLGSIEPWLEAAGYSITHTGFFQTNELPDIGDIDLLVVMGGPMSVNDPLPWIEQELALIRMAQDKGLPVLGHCLGGQLISRALGGTVTANPVKEIGWHPVRRTAYAAAADWLRDIPGEPMLFHWHGETFSLPGGAELILENDHCAHQAFVMGNTLALQCHVEMTAAMVHEWVALYEDELQETTASVQSADHMTNQLTARIRAAQQVADRLYQRWLIPVLDER